MFKQSYIAQEIMQRMTKHSKAILGIRIAKEIGRIKDSSGAQTAIDFHSRKMEELEVFFKLMQFEVV